MLVAAVPWAECLRLAHSSALDPELILAEKLLAWAQIQNSDLIHLAQIYQYGPANIRDAKTARRVVAILEGGYDRAALSESVGSIVDAFLAA